MPAAVVGPPMFALDAMRMSSSGKFSIFPPIRQNSILTITMIKQKTKSSGAFVRISMIEAGTPMIKKNI